MKFFFFILIPFLLFSESPKSYSSMEEIFKKTWDETFPASYSKIIKKDVSGKGVAELKEGKIFIYLYLYKVFVPLHRAEGDGWIVDSEKGREVVVKFYWNPKDKEKQYKIDLGDLEEQDRRKIVRWIKPR